MAVAPEPKRPRAKRKRMPTHPLEMRAYRFAMDTTHDESQTLFGVLDRCWEVRNILATELQDDRRANRELREAGLPVRYLALTDQYLRVAVLQKAEPRYQGIHSQVLQNIASRIDEGTKRWLESLTVPGGRKVSAPGPIERKDYNSFTFPQCGACIGISGGRVHLSKLGSFKLIQHRKYRGTPKTLTLKWEEGQWWAILVCAVQGKAIYRDQALVEHLHDTGGDPGLSALLTLADGKSFDPPKALKEALAALRRESRSMARKFEARKADYEAEAVRRKVAGLPKQVPLREIPYSNRLRAQIKVVAKLHTKVARVREYHHRKLARIVERSYRKVAVEEHGLQFMIRNRKLARAASDRAIAGMKHWLASALGNRLLLTPNRRPGIGGNSQTCLCEAPVPKTLKDREHICPACGLVGPRDVVSANIVMQIAFGRNLLQQAPKVVESSTVAGQAIVRRGGTEGRRLPLTAELMSPSVPDGESASEARLIRQPLASIPFLKTWGGEPTRVAKSARISGKPLLLDEALGLVSGGDAPTARKHRPSGR